MDGKLTIFTDDGTPSTTEEAIQDQLKAGMENGDFVGGPVVRVSYVDIDANPDPNSNDGGDGVNTQDVTPRRRTAIGIVAAIASLLILALAIAWRRKNQQSEETVLSSTMQNDTTLDVGGDV